MKKIAVVTGANRGIGYEICRQLALIDNIQVVLTARTMEKAKGADTAVWLATHPDGGPHGGFFRDRAALDW